MSDTENIVAIFGMSLATGKKIRPLPAKRMVVFFRYLGAVKWTGLPSPRRQLGSPFSNCRPACLHAGRP